MVEISMEDAQESRDRKIGERISDYKKIKHRKKEQAEKIVEPAMFPKNWR
ncbi:MAG: hypothetical protein IPM77_04225 [Crocinitomicaceae bacterium]|nr:hypothetical protein [Crocinitomicaceae bacterium]